MDKLVDITMHIDQSIPQADLEKLRDRLLTTNGVMAADYQQKTPHLMVIGYDPDRINAREFIRIAQQNGVHAELLGL